MQTRRATTRQAKLSNGKVLLLLGSPKLCDPESVQGANLLAINTEGRARATRGWGFTDAADQATRLLAED